MIELSSSGDDQEENVEEDLTTPEGTVRAEEEHEEQEGSKIRPQDMHYLVRFSTSHLSLFLTVN